jgi:hypothetical protein
MELDQMRRGVLAKGLTMPTGSPKAVNLGWRP